MWKSIALRPIVLAAALMLLAACASTAGVKTGAAAPADTEIAEVLWRGSQGGWVYRVAAEPGAPPLAHPVQLDPAWLRRYLASLTVTDRRGDEVSELTLFRGRQLDRLVPALVHGLARAQADQVLVFAVVGPRPGARIFQQNVVTTGRAFVENGRLNIVFGRVLDTVFDPGETAAFSPGSRDRVSLERGREVHSSLWAGDAKRRDWVRIAVQRGDGPLPELPESARVAPDSSAPAKAPGAAAPAAQPGIRGKLEMLKSLYEDDLITREEYARERAEVLDSL